MYINGHFCYADKFAILTNGLGIVRHISFTDDGDFKSSYPELVVEKKNDSLDEDRSVGDSAFDSSLSMKYCGITKEKGRSDRIKWICPKMHYHMERYL